MTRPEVSRALTAVSRDRHARPTPQRNDELKQEFNLLINHAKFLSGRGLRDESYVCGWPARALADEVESKGGGVVKSKHSLRVALRDKTFYLPVELIWPGFAINTVFYAAVLWLLFAAPFALRRRMRIKRGLCPKCAYDLRGTQRGERAAGESRVCPECGTSAGGIQHRAGG